MDNPSRFVFSGPSSWPLEQAIQLGRRARLHAGRLQRRQRAELPGHLHAGAGRAIRSLAAEHGVASGIHSSSAVNMAEITPVMAAAADEYVRQNLDLAAVARRARTSSCHGGFHFSSDVEGRFAASHRAAAAGRSAGRGARPRASTSRTTTPSRSTPRSTTSRTPSPRRAASSTPSRRRSCAGPATSATPCWCRTASRGSWTRSAPTASATSGCTTPTASTRSTSCPARASSTSATSSPRCTERGYRGPFTLDFGTPEQKAHWRDEFAALLDEVSAVPGADQRASGGGGRLCPHLSPLPAGEGTAGGPAARPYSEAMRASMLARRPGGPAVTESESDHVRADEGVSYGVRRLSRVPPPRRD